MKPSRVYKDHSNGSGPSTKVGHIQRLKWRGGRQIKTCNCMLNLLACWENLRISLLFKQPSHYLSLQGDNQCMKRASDQPEQRELQSTSRKKWHNQMELEHTDGKRKRKWRRKKIKERCEVSLWIIQTQICLCLKEWTDLYDQQGAAKQTIKHNIDTQNHGLKKFVCCWSALQYFLSC